MFMLSNMVQKLIEKIEDKEKRGPFYKPKILINIYNKTDFLLLRAIELPFQIYLMLWLEKIYILISMFFQQTHIYMIY